MKLLAPTAIILLSTFALLWRIDATVLWRDEASTASWAREMVESGHWLPRVFNGERLMVQGPDGHDFNDRFLPVMQGWLQFYVAAIGLALGGSGTAAARLPFVAAGAVALGALYRAAREVFGSRTAALAAPLLGATSIYFLTAARQARYYGLVVLFTALVLLELARWRNRPELARSTTFWARIGLYGALTYFANYLSFAALWLSLAVFVAAAGDRALRRGFAVLTAILAPILGAEFLLLHGDFASSYTDVSATWRDYWNLIDYHASQLGRMMPLAAMVPAAWYVFARRRERGPAATMALLCVCVVVVSVAGTLAAAGMTAIARYYFQIVPAAVLLAAILTERLWALAGRGWALAFLAAALLWPNLNFYHQWCVNAVERQLTADRAAHEPIVEFLRNNVAPHETVAFYRNVQGMMAYFNLPRLRWVALLDSEAPRNQRLRGRLPDYLFDDYDGVDWYVVWDNRDRMPKKLTADHKLVWEHSYIERYSWWDRRAPERTLSYRVYRRSRAAPARQ